MGSDGIYRVVGPHPTMPDEDVPYVPAVWPRYGSPLRVIVLGADVRAVPVHWTDGRTRPCWAPNHCGACNVKKRRYVQYHLACWETEKGREVMLCLTAQAAASLLNLATEHGQLRGLDVVIYRTRGRTHSHVEYEFLAAYGPEHHLRAPFDLEPQLQRLFNVEIVPQASRDKGEK